MSINVLRTGCGVAAMALALIAPSFAIAQSGPADDGRYRPRIYVTPKHRYLPPHAKRDCRAWLQKEYRVSGTVVTPQMRCRWVY